MIKLPEAASAALQVAVAQLVLNSLRHSGFGQYEGGQYARPLCASRERISEVSVWTLVRNFLLCLEQAYKNSFEP